MAQARELERKLSAAQEKVGELEGRLKQSKADGGRSAKQAAVAVDVLRGAVAARDDEIRRLEGTVQQEKFNLREMEAAFVGSESRCQELEQSAARARELFDLGDVGDVQRIVTGLQDLNDAMDEITFAFLEQVDDRLLQGPLVTSLDNFARERATSGRLNAHHFLNSVRRAAGSSVKLDDVLHPFLKVIIAEEVYQAVLGPFHPLVCGADTSALLGQVHRQVKAEGRCITTHSDLAMLTCFTWQETERKQPNGARRLSAPSRRACRTRAMSSSSRSETPSYKRLNPPASLLDTLASALSPSSDR